MNLKSVFLIILFSSCFSLLEAAGDICEKVGKEQCLSLFGIEDECLVIEFIKSSDKHGHSLFMIDGTYVQLNAISWTQKYQNQSKRFQALTGNIVVDTGASLSCFSIEGNVGNKPLTYSLLYPHVIVQHSTIDLTFLSMAWFRFVGMESSIGITLTQHCSDKRWAGVIGKDILQTLRAIILTDTGKLIIPLPIENKAITKNLDITKDGFRPPIQQFPIFHYAQINNINWKNGDHWKKFYTKSQLKKIATNKFLRALLSIKINAPIPLVDERLPVSKDYLEETLDYNEKNKAYNILIKAFNERDLEDMEIGYDGIVGGIFFSHDYYFSLPRISEKDFTDYISPQGELEDKSYAYDENGDMEP